MIRELSKTKNREVDIKMLNFILRLLVPSYFEYQEEMEKQMKTLERELKENE